MPDLLEFKPNRDLSFDPRRDLGFNPRRDLGFDSGRDLTFQPGRDLGFGKRGRVFRGYVCPVCNAAVTAEQPKCTECGAVFEPKAVERMKAKAPPPAPALSPPRAPTPPAPSVFAAPPPPPSPLRTYPAAPKRIDVHNCVHCGARVSTTDTFCWNCGNPMYAGQGR